MLYNGAMITDDVVHTWLDALEIAFGEIGIEAVAEEAIKAHRVVTLRLAVRGPDIDRALRQGSAVRAALGWPKPLRMSHDGRHLAIEVPLKLSARWPTASDLRLGRDLRVHLGFGADGAPAWLDLAETPNLFIGGQTRGGKTNAERVIVHQLALQNQPRAVQLALLDPHRDQLGEFDGLPHLRWPRASDADGFRATLQACDALLEERHAGASADTWLIVVCDEVQLLDRGASELLRRLATGGVKRRIQVVVATQYKRGDTVDPVVTAQCTARLCFRVDSPHLSHATLGRRGAGGEYLDGRGDALLATGGDVARIQTALWRAEDREALPYADGAAVADAPAPHAAATPHWSQETREVPDAALDWIMAQAKLADGSWRLPGRHRIVATFGCGFETAAKWQGVALEVLNQGNRANTPNPGRVIEFSRPVTE